MKYNLRIGSFPFKSHGPKLLIGHVRKSGCVGKSVMSLHYGGKSVYNLIVIWNSKT